MKIQNLLLFYGQHFDFQILYLNVLNYRYFHTNIQRFLNKKTLEK